MVGFKIVEITENRHRGLLHRKFAIGKDFSLFPRSTILEHTRLRQFDLWAMVLSTWGQRVEGDGALMAPSTGWAAKSAGFPQVEQRDRIRVELGKSRWRDAAADASPLIVIDRIMQSNRHVLPLVLILAPSLRGAHSSKSRKTGLNIVGRSIAVMVGEAVTAHRAIGHMVRQRHTADVHGQGIHSEHTSHERLPRRQSA